MAKIMCITTGLTGILNASFELMARLTAAGHQVVYASPREVGPKVQAEGFAYVQLPKIELDTAPKLPTFKSPLRKLKRLVYKLKYRKQRSQEALNKLSKNGFLEMLSDQQADLLLIDIELHEYIIKAYAENKKVVLLSQWFSSWKRKGLPYLLHDTIPGKGWGGSALAMELSWWKVKFQRWWTFIKKKITSGFSDRRSTLLAYAKQEGFPLQLIKENYWPGPFTYNGLPVMSMTIKEMEFPHDVRPHLFYVGPMVAESRMETGKEESNGWSIDEVLDHRQKTEAKLLYCSVSTLHAGDRLFITKLMEAVSDESDYLLLIGMGGLIEKGSFGKLPANVFAFEYVPQLKVLAKADLSINHGGIHTINECIHFRVPMLVYSGKRSDQNGCAARVAYHGLGLMGDKDKDSSQQIQANIKTILKDNAFQKRVDQMYQCYQGYKEKQVLENLISDFLPKAQQAKAKT